MTKSKKNTIKKTPVIKKTGYYGYAHGLDVKDSSKKRYSKERKKYGFDDTEIWCLYGTISKFMLPRLKRLREIYSYDESLELDPTDITMVLQKEWVDDLDQIINFFELIANEEFTPITEEEVELFNKSFDLFKKRFFHLWC